MKIFYDPEVDALYIRLSDEPTDVTTQRLSEEVAINYSPDGKIVGIEVLDASEYVFRLKEDRAIKFQNLIAVLG